MDITLTDKAIKITLRYDSVNLKPLMYFIENSFKDVKSYCDTTVVTGCSDEAVKIKYMIRWAYNIYCKSPNRSNDVNFRKLCTYMHLPIHIVRINHMQITQVLTMTIEQVSDNVLSVTSSQYNSHVVKYFKNTFEDSMSRSIINRKIFRLSINTKRELMLLKEILSMKEISNIKVSFITYGINFKKLNKEHIEEEKLKLQEKLNKCYIVLSIDNNSTPQEIKNNYRKMLKKYHPDRVYNKDSSVIELYTKRFQVIQKAYEMVQEHHNNVA